MWQPVVLCNVCRQRHLCLRRVSEPCTLAIICHGCEASLMVEVTEGELTIQRSADSQQTGAPFFITGLPVTHPSSVRPRTDVAAEQDGVRGRLAPPPRPADGRDPQSNRGQ